MIFVSCYNGVFWLTLGGVILYLLALPPTGLWWFAWLVAACWTPILRRKTLPLRAYRKIWLAGVIFWAVAVHWICYAHWATCFGWAALSCYLGIYFPLFLFFARTIHHTRLLGNFRFPVWFAAPVAWLAAMHLQKTLMGGFGFALLEHTQFKQTALIQLADMGGESLVGAVMIFVGVLFGYCLPVPLSETPDTTKECVSKPSFRQTVACLVVISLTFFTLVSYARLRESQRIQSEKPPLRVALLQGNFKASLSVPPEWYEEVFEKYKELAVDTARNHNRKIDVMIWPESICTYPWYDVDGEEWLDDTSKVDMETIINMFLLKNNTEIIELSQTLGIPCIYGVPSYVYSERNEKYYQYNSALLLENVNEIDYNETGQQQPLLHFYRYDKMLLVMFGEYIPFAEYLPEGFFLKSLCQRADFGRIPVNFILNIINDCNVDHINSDYGSKQYSYSASTNICFESSSSRLIRQQVLNLKELGEEPDLLINLSNDGWFHHSTQIDMHLATHVFRAIENRKPYLAATNGGFSVGIDGSGKLLAIGQRRTNQVVDVDLTSDNRSSAYLFWGSFFHLTSLGWVFLMLFFPMLQYGIHNCLAGKKKTLHQ